MVGRHVHAGCALSFAAAAGSNLRGHQVWVTICAGLPGALVCWAALDDPYGLTHHRAAVIAIPLALAGIAQVLRVRGRRQRKLDTLA
ncbi:hypothetical protein ACFVYC_13670 [Pseudarthrobacter sp. NPDC058329]|uniref:hypothetical protein n=1 Tax=Pseudarthrobacter sp. NPDC058329 TaxID=3346448 RepID=UPI0036DBA073